MATLRSLAAAVYKASFAGLPWFPRKSEIIDLFEAVDDHIADVAGAGAAFAEAADQIGSGSGVVVFEDGVFDVADREEFRGPPGSNVMSIPTFVGLSGADVSAETDLVITSSHSGQTDNEGNLVGSARYVASDAMTGLEENAWTAQVADGRFFVLAETKPNPDQFGATGQVVVDREGDHTGISDHVALQALLDYATRDPDDRMFCGEIEFPRLYLSNETLFMDNAFELQAIGSGGLVAGPGIGPSEQLIVLQDSVDSGIYGLSIIGNSAKPDGLIEFRNTGGHSRTTASMARLTVAGCRFNGGLGNFGCNRLVRVTDTQQKMDNNSEHRFINNHLWGYERSAISLESQNSLQNLVEGNICENPPTNNADVRMVETVSVMRALPTDLLTPVEQGGGGFVFASGEAIIHGGLGSEDNTTSTLFYLRGNLLHDIEIANLTVEDNCRFLDVDISAMSGTAIQKISITNCHQKGGAGDTGTPIPTLNLKTGTRRLIVDLISTSIGLGRGGATINLDGANVYMSMVGGVLNVGSVTGTGHLSVYGTFGAPGTTAIADTIANFSAFGFQGTYTYLGYTVNGVGALGMFTETRFHDNVRIMKPGAVLVLKSPNNQDGAIRVSDDGTVRFNSPNYASNAQREFLNALNATTTTATAGAGTLPAAPVGFLTVRHQGGDKKIPFYS